MSARAPLCPPLHHCVRAATAIEFALVFPALILVILGTVATYTLIASRRAMDYGIEKALRAAAVNSAGGTAAVSAAYARAAGVMWSAAGTTSGVTVLVGPGGNTPVAASTFAPGDTVKVSASFNWVAPAGLGGTLANAIFSGATLTATGSVRVIN